MGADLTDTGGAFPPFSRPSPRSVPYYGISNEAAADGDDEYYSDEEDFDLEEALDQLEAAYEDPGEGDSWGPAILGGMTDTWPSNVPNRLGTTRSTGQTSSSSTNPDDPRLSCLGLPLALPYEVETLEEMDDRLEHICCKLAECVKAREWQMGFRTWDNAFGLWMSMGYVMKKEIKIKLIFLYWEVIFVPGIPTSLKEDAANTFISLISDRSLNVFDFRIPWRPLYDALSNELFPHPSKLSRHSENLAPVYLNVAESAQRFFHPGDVDEMLEVILPHFKPNMDSILATQTFLVHFLPISHCQKWLPLIFRLWHGFNSGLWDDQASDLAGQLAIAHTDPARSDPALIAKIPRGTLNTPEEEASNPNIKKTQRAHKARLLDVAGEIEEDDDGLNYWVKQDLLPPEEHVADPSWQGIRKDIGIFSDQEFEFLMTKCLRSLNVPVGGSIASSNAMSMTMSDVRVSRNVIEAKKPIDRVQSLAEAIIFSMSEDAPVPPVASEAATPGNVTPMPSAISRLQNGASMKRTASGDSLAAAGKKSEENRKFLGGSKALDHLSRLLTSLETFFHPSNSGSWSSFLTVFLLHLSTNFVERWKSEEEPHCKTPSAWRLTSAIKRDFVLTIRPLALTAMFNKDDASMTPAVGTLKKLAVLEPDLIMPATIERAIPSLQGLEETQRTPAVTYTLAVLAEPLTARRLWKFGGVYIADILALLLPGIDLNDPSKTGLTCMALTNMVDFIHLSDISEVDETDESQPGDRALRRVPRAPVQDDPNDPIQLDLEDLSHEEINARMRFATSAFRDWVPEFLGRVLLLFANLPEEGGKSGKAGGKTEQLTLTSVLHTCGTVFAALDNKLFEQSLDQICEYATTTTRANAVDAIGELVRNLASASGDKTFAKLFPLAKQRITQELRAGASSTRTTTTSIPLPADAALHWWQSILYGMLIPGRINLSATEFRAQYIELLQLMVDSTFSERGWWWTGRILERSMSCLISIYFKDMRMIPAGLRDSEDFKKNHTAYWGKLYRSAEINPEWNVPTPEDINMAFEIIAIADKCAMKIGNLIENKAFGDKVWTNEFCRSAHVIDKILKGSYNLFLEDPASKSGGKPSETYLPEEFLQLPKPFKAGLTLLDPKDPRHQHVTAFRRRVGETLHHAASVMRDAGESDNSVETVKSLVTVIGTFLTAYGIRSKQFANAQSAYSGLQNTKSLYDSQRKYHRTVFMAAASVHNQNRLSSMAYYRTRSELDDRLITNMLDFCLSPFTRIRRSAQSQLETIARVYRGTWVLCFETLFHALQPGTDPDRMKGALYVLRHNPVGISRISRTWRPGQLVRLAECLLNAHHENKASVQALVSKATDDLIASMREPTSYLTDFQVDAVDAAVDRLSESLRYKPDTSLIQRLNISLRDTKALQDDQWDNFVDRVMAIAANPQLNWRYHHSASRLLYVVIRRDKPSDVRLATYFSKGMTDAHPRIRDYGYVGTTKMLYQAVFRYMCKIADRPEERIFIQETSDPISSEIALNDTSPAFTQKYLESFREPLPEDQSKAVLQDRLSTGWLAWGKTIEVCRMTGWEEYDFYVDEECKPGIEQIRPIIESQEFWQTTADFWAQEEQRNHPSATHIDLVVASTQLFPQVFDLIRPIVDNYLAVMAETSDYDRHKTRAMYEFIAGLVRGSEDWSGKNRKAFWEWLAPKLPELFGNIRHDTTKCWDIVLEFILHERDPRRYPDLIDFVMTTAKSADFANGSSFDLTRRVQLIRSCVRCLQWKFSAWADEFASLYFTAVNCPYAEVRGLISALLNAIDQLKFHPSYPSAKALTEDVLNDPDARKDIMHIRSGHFTPQLEELMKNLRGYKMERPHGPKAVQSAHDLTANTVLMWLIVECSDVHAVAAFPYIIPFLPELFELRDLNDNPDLQRTAMRLLTMITSITPSFDLLEPLMESLISILQNAESWRTKTHCMPILSLVYYRNLSLLSESCKAKSLDIVSKCLRDPNSEVREIASATLSGFLRCSQRPMVDVLRHRFTREIQAIQLPKRRAAPGQVNPEYQAKIVELHGAILGATALVEAFPYTVPKFMPKLLADVLAPRVSDPPPISTTIRNTVASFKRTHEKYQDKFTEDELSAMNYAQAGNSYYA